MADKSLLELPLATSIGNALVYGVQNNQDVAIPAQLFGQDSEPVPANTFYAGPISPPGGMPAFRPLIAADIPDLSNVYLKSNDGTLVSPTINNAQIVGGSLSGVTATFDDDKFIVRNVTDTTKRARWNISPIPAGTTAVFSVPAASTTLVGTDSDQTLTNKKLVVKASTSASSGLTLPIGVPPSSPVEGDVWLTAAGMYARVSGATVGPFAPALSSAVTSFNGRTGAINLSTGDVTNALGYTPYNTSSDTFVRKSGDSMTGPITSPQFIDFIGNLRTGTGGIDSKLSLSGGTVTGFVGFNARTSPQISWKSANGSADRIYITSDENSVSFNSVSNGGAYNGTILTLSRNSLNARVGGEMGSLTSRLYGTDNQIVLDGSISSVPTIAIVHNHSSGSLGFYDQTNTRWVAQFNRANRNADFFGNVNTTGTITAAGGFGPGSDPRLKEEDSLEEVHDAVERVYNLNVRKGKYKDWYNSDGKDRIFLMADNAMEQYAPNVFQKDLVDVNGNKYNGWSADQMIALLVKTVQELTDRIEDLEGRLDEQQN